MIPQLCKLLQKIHPRLQSVPLTPLTSPLVKFHWNQEADAAFVKLKHLFTSAPALIHPDLCQQFVSAPTGVGGILSQRHGPENKLHSCALFSRWLLSAENNYDVGNRELLAVKLTVEEWRHWLEGTEQPFVVWTDHKNLVYIQSA